MQGSLYHLKSIMHDCKGGKIVQEKIFQDATQHWSKNNIFVAKVSKSSVVAESPEHTRVSLIFGRAAWNRLVRIVTEELKKVE